ncbi:MAG TPA: pseudaminic acid synthase [Candidatus Bilamarchaeaceae archaeon]|nr:pseudaminic acid synthase [Candidatus Bilamarchaeaceae archaeon]
MKTITIGKRRVGHGEPCLIVAEISCNHLQKKEYALKLIGEAKAAGADAVKFQTYTPDTITIDSDNEYFRIKGTLWNGRKLYDLYKEAYTPWDWFPELKDRAEEDGLVFFSTPFDETAVDFLEKLSVPAYKIASFEINHIPLIKYVAGKGKPVIFSTGVGTREDIELALKTIRAQKNEQIIMMKCTSAYPAPVGEMNLATIPDMERKFGVLAGLSDHSMNEVVPVSAVAAGACVVEKHFMLRRSEGGPDAAFSLEPAEFKKMVEMIRNTEAALGEATYENTEEAGKHKFIMRSIFAVEDIRKGEKFTRENIRVIRPGHGLHPKHYEEILGKAARAGIKRGTPLKLEMVG